MFKIGIMTTSHAINYGAVLQAYSLEKTIEEEIPDAKVEIINYCGNERIAGRKIYRDSFNLRNLVINAISFFRFRYRKNRKSLIILFDNFKKDYLNISSDLIKTGEELQDLLGYDVIVCGSDQVWNLNLFNDSAYFLTFASNKVKKIAYAVSISDKLNENQMEEIAEKAHAFQAISIRESDDAEKLSGFMKQRIESIIDPVFLHNSKEWERLLSICEIRSEKILFVFLISHQKNDQDMIKQIKGNRKVVVLNLHPIRYVFGDEEINVCSPNQFVEMVAKADMILTDSFHCTAFAIIFNKQFYNIKRPTRNNRIENLYNLFGITPRWVDDFFEIDKKIDYKDINDTLIDERNKGRAFIKENIGNYYDKQ